MAAHNAAFLIESELLGGSGWTKPQSLSLLASILPEEVKKETAAGEKQLQESSLLAALALLHQHAADNEDTGAYSTLRSPESGRNRLTATLAQGACCSWGTCCTTAGCDSTRLLPRRAAAACAAA